MSDLEKNWGPDLFEAALRGLEAICTPMEHEGMMDEVVSFGDHVANHSERYGGGELHRFWFDNGYGASVVQNTISYGHQEGLWELAVLTGTNDTFRLVYDTPITDDVIGRLSVEDVAKVLDAIAALPSRIKALPAGQ